MSNYNKVVSFGLLTLIVSLVFGLSYLGNQNQIALGAIEPNTNTIESTDFNQNSPPLILSDNPYLIADIAERAMPATVMITVEWPARDNRELSPFTWFFGNNNPFDWYFEPFFGERGPIISGGSGFIIDQEGHIFTNQHVVGDANEGQTIKVKLMSIEDEVEAEIVGSDYTLDLAILKLKEIPEQLKGKLPTLPMGDSDQSRPGEWVIAIGNPYGYEHTVTGGFLSAKGREITVYDQNRRQTRQYRNLLQTDAAINSGNSGGPLINIKGEVIGINTAVRADGQGIGFAIPINTAISVKDELIQNGHVNRPEPTVTSSYTWTPQVISLVLGADPLDPNKPLIGIYHGDVTPEMAEQIGLKEAKGVIISSVMADSAAQKAGLRVYDVITQIDNQEIANSEELKSYLSKAKPGQQILMVVLRPNYNR